MVLLVLLVVLLTDDTQTNCQHNDDTTATTTSSTSSSSSSSCSSSCHVVVVKPARTGVCDEVKRPMRRKNDSALTRTTSKVFGVGREEVEECGSIRLADTPFG